MVERRPQRYQDKHQAHYTKSSDIVAYMVSRLNVRNEDCVWEPCGGDGHLVDGVLESAPYATVLISEIRKDAAEFLTEKYRGNSNVRVKNEDALDTGFVGNLEVKITRIVANPPYGAWQSQEKRLELKKRFPDLYVRESYAVFLYHCLRNLKTNGKLVFIIPDTFLWLNRHELLRRTLLKETSIEEISLFTSRFFPDISFGYSGMCIITLKKGIPEDGNDIRVLDQFVDRSVLGHLAKNPTHDTGYAIAYVKQKEMLRRTHAEFIKPSLDIVNINGNGNHYLVDVADVKTGFYSGNDRQWLRCANSSVPRSNGYTNVDPDKIFQDTNGHPSLSSISGNRCFIPTVRGGASSFIKPTQWYVDWSEEAVKEYTRKGNNPARFQNSQFYFRQGIGVPMVASARLTAALLDERLFDQGIVAIFPHDSELSLYLLGFLNTNFYTALIRQINSTANNSANYLKRIKIVMPNSDQLKLANNLISDAIETMRDKGFLQAKSAEEIETLYRKIWRND